MGYGAMDSRDPERSVESVVHPSNPCPRFSFEARHSQADAQPGKLPPTRSASDTIAIASPSSSASPSCSSSRASARAVHVPVLALNGTLDLQVPWAANLPEIDAALAAAGNRDYRIVELPGLNHLFQPAATGDPAEYERITETFSPAALELIADWITAHAAGSRSGRESGRHQ